MKRYVIIIVFILICIYFFSKTYRRTIFLENKYTTCGCKLYVEVYSVGILNNLKSEYLTDSLNFRIHTGVFDDESAYIYYHCTGDSISIEKVERINQTITKIDSVMVKGESDYNFQIQEDTLKTQSKYNLKFLKSSKLRWLLYKL